MRRSARPWERLAAWSRAHPRSTAALLLALLAGPMLATAWVAEDAFISFRSVEQLLAGNGPRWNPHERVQSFTHPLWFGVLALGRLAVGDAYWAALGLDLAAALAAVGVLFHLERARPDRLLWIAALLLSSKAWVDYTTSGLENALSYLLLAGFLATALRLEREPARRSAAGFGAALLLAGLLALNRLDSLALVGPPAAWVAWRARRQLGTRAAVALVGLAAAPLAAWTAFSIVYFGFPLPNTAYAKLNTGIPAAELARQGLFYLWNSLRWDPITLGITALAAALAWRRAAPLWRALSLGLLLHLAYLVRIGGDFMSGRFLGVGYLAAALLVAECAGRRQRWALAAVLVLLPLLSDSHPLRFTRFEKRSDEHRVADERSYYADATSLATCLRRARAGLGCPDHEWAREGRALRLSRKPIEIRKAIGMYGHAAGVEPIIIDSLGLADPLLARLRVDGDWRVGHYWRRVPEGYAATLLTGRNQIRDPSLREWYDHLSLVIRGPLFSRERWVTIARMNCGGYRPLLESYARSSPR